MGQQVSVAMVRCAARYATGICHRELTAGVVVDTGLGEHGVVLNLGLANRGAVAGDEDQLGCAAGVTMRW